MLWRSAQRAEDEPGWREKLADWRDSPPWILERPAWMPEHPLALVLFLLGTVAALLSVLYVAVPPTALPADMPGSFSVARTRAEFYATTSTTGVSTTTTTTIAPLSVRLARRRERAAWTPEQRAKNEADYKQWVMAAADFRKQQAEEDAILNSPPEPPFRRWSYALYAGVAAAAALFAAWFMSDVRSRRLWGNN